MARLNEVVSGILRDLVESRVAADSLSRQQAEIYSTDPVLTQLPVPRFAIKEANIKLRFTIDDVVVAKSPMDTAAVRKAWAQEVVGSVLPRALSAARLDAEASGALLKKLQSTDATLDVEALIAGTASEAAAAAVKWVVDNRAALPAESRDRLELQALRRSVSAELRTAAVDFAPRVRQMRAVDAVLESGLDIVIKRADLAQVPDSQIHEITLVFSTDDLQLGSRAGTSEATVKRG